jgi:hypothetical protein
MNNKKEVIPLRTRKGSVYQKGTNEVFKLADLTYKFPILHPFS